jgi:hypothetical protein
VIQQLILENANAEKASEKAKAVKGHLIQMQNDFANGLRGMLEVQVEAAKPHPFIDHDIF